MKGEAPALELQGLTGGHGLPLGQGKLTRISAPIWQILTARARVPRSSGGLAGGCCPGCQLGRLRNWSGAARAVCKDCICYQIIIKEEAVSYSWSHMLL